MILSTQMSLFAVVASGNRSNKEGNVVFIVAVGHVYCERLGISVLLRRGTNDC